MLPDCSGRAGSPGGPWISQAPSGRARPIADLSSQLLSAVGTFAAAILAAMTRTSCHHLPDAGGYQPSASPASWAHC
jgi:hypothetical protein